MSHTFVPASSPSTGKTAPCLSPKWKVSGEPHLGSSVQPGGSVKGRKREICSGVDGQNSPQKSSGCFEEQPLSAQSSGEIRGKCEVLLQMNKAIG